MNQNKQNDRKKCLPKQNKQNTFSDFEKHMF